jgi:hypothetical protein
MSEEQRPINRRPIKEEKTYQEALIDLFRYHPSDMEIKYDKIAYSNDQYTQVTARDLYIDFLELPGYKEDGTQTIHAVRIYMSRDTAKTMAEGVLRLLEESSHQNAL